MNITLDSRPKEVIEQYKGKNTKDNTKNNEDNEDEDNEDNEDEDNENNEDDNKKFKDKSFCNKDLSILIEDPEVYNVTIENKTVYELDEENKDETPATPIPISVNEKKKKQCMNDLIAMEEQLYVNADNNGKLHPGHEWAVPIKKLRKCTNSCAKCFINPHDIQNELSGTWLDDAKNTEIGSILPKFVYKEFTT